MVFRLANFDFELPPDRIAHRPVRPRDAARLLCVQTSGGCFGYQPDHVYHGVRPCSGHASSRPGHETGGDRKNPQDARLTQDSAQPSNQLPGDGRNLARIEDRVVRDLPDLLCPGDIVVVNDTRVIPAQLTTRLGNARIIITLDQPRAEGTWHALARNARRLHEGDKLRFDGPSDLSAVILARDLDGGVILRFDQQDAEFDEALRRDASLALPPYISRPHGPEPADATDYQTVFANNDGAVAAPTAGLHFTPALLTVLEARGILRAFVTLHVGAGTFLPVRSDDVSHHTMHAEYGEISASTAHAINDARAGGGRIVAIGTTSLRLLESAVDASGMIAPFAGQTSLFILPGYRFRAVDVLMTNFHLPRSTLFMLVCAFAGTETMRAAYAHAVAAGYRFYSYGDASLLYRYDR